MLLIAGQTAGPNGLKFHVDTQGWPGSVKDKKSSISFFLFKIFFFYGQRRTLQLV